MFSFFSGLLIFSVFRREEGEEGSTIPKIKRKFIVRRVRVGMKHVVRRVARPNGKFILQNLLAFDLSCVEPAGFFFFFLKKEGIECAYIYIARWYVLSRIKNNARLRPVEPALVMRKKSLMSPNICLLLSIKDSFTVIY